MVALLSVSLIAVTCVRGPRPTVRPPASPASPLPTPPASFSVVLGGARVDSLLGLARAQTFDTAYRAGDSQRLMLGSFPAGSAHGPFVRIQPNVGSHLATRAQLAAGFVVARWVNEDATPYWKLGSLGRDTTYWFVDSIPGTWRSRYVSTGGADSIVVDTSLVIHQSGGVNAQSIARWVWLDSDETGWVTCTTTGCCSSSKTLK